MTTVLHTEAINDVIHTILGSEQVTFSIRNRQSGELLYRYRDEHLMRPASNMKLISGAAALHYLGESYTFSTRFYVDRVVEGVTQNLYVQGTGDPTVNGELFKQVAQALQAHGVTTIARAIIGDDSRFPGETLPPGVAEEDETYYYGARVSAITMSPTADYDASTIYVEVTPTAIGAQPSFNVVPYLSGHTIENQAVTVAESEENTLDIQRVHGTNHIVITGNIPLHEPMKIWVSLQNPTVNTLQYMRHILAQHGIVFAEQVVIEQGIVPATAACVLEHRSPTIAELFNPFMKLSNNSIADIFVRTIGYEHAGVGTYEAGLQKVREYLQQLGVDESTWQFVDGSGMSHQIRVSSKEISKLLHVLQQQPYFETFYHSLPVAGNEDRAIGGTLKERYIEPHLANRIIAKTGYITKVHALSGYIVGDSGEHYIFSLLLEGYEEGIEILDRGLKEILKYL